MVAVVAIPAGLGLGAMALGSPGEYRFARWCFWTTAILAAGAVFMLQWKDAGALTSWRMVLNGAAGAIIFIALTYALGWVDKKEGRAAGDALGTALPVIPVVPAAPVTTTIGPQSGHVITNYNGPVTVTHEAPGKTPNPAHEAVPEAQGGKGGGGGEIFGNGTIIGGRGGNVGSGGRGRGGDGGGGGIVRGDGMIIGGEGGSVDGTHIWYPPAQSGFVQFLEEHGQTPDWGAILPGQGGMSGSYFVKHKIVAEIRAEYFRENGMTDKLASSKIGDVPLDYVNAKLAKAGYDWRARIDRKYWYLYYVPDAP